MDIVKNKTYKIKGDSEYFQKKYGTSNPEFRLEDTDINVLGCDALFGSITGNPACMLYIMRAEKEGLDFNHGKSYYGKVGNLGELVHESELEEI